MIVGIPREVFPRERRVSLVPAQVGPLGKAGFGIRVESGAGTPAGFADQEYADKGAQIVSRAEALAADIVLGVRWDLPDDSASEAIAVSRSGQILIGMWDPWNHRDLIQRWAEKGAVLFALELLPRITRAQSMDVLSAMATLAGYRAVILAAVSLPRIFPMLMTAAGTLTPAKVFVIGAGVAGLQAIATARRLGAAVSAYDVRPAVKEQVQSLGAKFVELELETAAAEDKGGYAKELGEEFYRKQREMMARVLAQSDVVISTASIPGKRAPLLITADMVRGMQPGSVIVDLAAERGGNCELTKVGETVVENGVSIVGPANLPADLPYHGSQMYSKNVTTFLQHLVKNGAAQLDADDQIIRETMLCRNGRIIHAGLAGA